MPIAVLEQPIVVAHNVLVPTATFAVLIVFPVLDAFNESHPIAT